MLSGKDTMLSSGKDTMLSGKNTMLCRGKKVMLSGKNICQENNNNIVRKNTMPTEFRGVFVVWYRQGSTIEAYKHLRQCRHVVQSRIGPRGHNSSINYCRRWKEWGR